MDIAFVGSCGNLSPILIQMRLDSRIIIYVYSTYTFFLNAIMSIDQP